MNKKPTHHPCSCISNAAFIAGHVPWNLQWTKASSWWGHCLSLRLIPAMPRPLLELAPASESFVSQDARLELGLHVRCGPSAPDTWPELRYSGERANRLRVGFPLFHKGNNGNFLVRLWGRIGGSKRGPHILAPRRGDTGHHGLGPRGPALDSSRRIRLLPGYSRPTAHCGAGFPVTCMGSECGPRRVFLKQLGGCCSFIRSSIHASVKCPQAGKWPRHC